MTLPRSTSMAAARLATSVIRSVLRTVAASPAARGDVCDAIRVTVDDDHPRPAPRQLIRGRGPEGARPDYHY